VTTRRTAGKAAARASRWQLFEGDNRACTIASLSLDWIRHLLHNRRNSVSRTAMSATTWFLLLLAASIVGPYAFGVRPRTRSEWTYVAIAIAFVAWMLVLMAPLRSL